MQYVDRNVGPADYANLNKDQLLVTKVFYTIQSEGPLSGTPAVFIRLAGCNKGDKLSCPDCDTNFIYSNGTIFTAQELAETVSLQFKESFRLGLAANPPLVVLSGGEPMLQDNVVRLLEACHSASQRVQIESNGDRLPIDFTENDACRRAMLVVSPKVNPASKHYPRLSAAVFKRADYLKFVVAADPNSSYHALPEYIYEWCMARNTSDRIFISPWTVYQRPVNPDEIASIWIDDLIDKERTQANLHYAVNLCLKYGYRLSLQTHLITGVEQMIYRWSVYWEMWWSQLRDRNAGARLTVRERLRRGHRLGTMACLTIKGPPYRAPRWMRSYDGNR